MSFDIIKYRKLIISISYSSAFIFIILLLFGTPGSLMENLLIPIYFVFSIGVVLLEIVRYKENKNKPSKKVEMFKISIIIVALCIMFNSLFGLVSG